VLPDLSLRGLRIYEFDHGYRLRSISFAERGSFQRARSWVLRGVVQTTFDDRRTSVRKIAEADWQSVLDPALLNVLQVKPEKMSAWRLHSYTQHLKENRQKALRYEIAFWTKVMYPVAVLAMMVLALPFAYFQRRQGGVGAKIVAGIMLGLAFHFLNKLFSYLGLLYDWPAVFSAVLPTLIVLSIALGMMWWQERR
jgi:lipopolysaccharide export system permease protein